MDLTERRKVLLRRVRRKARPFYRWIIWRSAPVLTGLCRRMSHAWALRLGRWVSLIWFIGWTRDRTTALANIDRVFAEKISPAGRRSLAYRSFQSATMAAVDAIHSAVWNPDYFRKVVAIDGHNHWRSALAAGKGVICVSGHIGSWELLGPSIVYHGGVRVDAMVRGLRDPRMNALLKEMRGSHGVHIYETTDAGLGYLRTLTDNGVVLLLVDLNARDLRSIEADFLSRPAMVLSGYAYLARTSGAAILPHVITRHQDDPRRHTLRYYEPIFADSDLPEEADVRRIIEQVTRFFEEKIFLYPEQWTWMHDRWRLGG